MIRVTIGRFYNESWIAYRVCLELLLLVFSYVWKHKFSLNHQTPLGSKKKILKNNHHNIRIVGRDKCRPFRFSKRGIKIRLLIMVACFCPYIRDNYVNMQHICLVIIVIITEMSWDMYRSMRFKLCCMLT